MTTNSGRAIEIFTEAIQLSVEDRVAFLDQACADNEALRQRIEALLRSNDRAGDFLESPPTVSISEGRGRIAAGEKPGQRIDRYKLLEQIGEGGWGVVFVAEQEEPVRRRVALKVVKPGMDTKGVIARFEAERQALALMDHPNIAHVFDAGATENGRPYFVMELVEGVKITEYCDRHSLPTSSRLELFAQVCLAIQHAHQKGIIHRDIKPSNILVATGPDSKPAPKVIDFGIAKAISGQRLTDKTIFTASEMLIGTPAYMSPEQAALTSVDVDTRSDIYSLGVLLYELLTSKTPFDTTKLMEAGFDDLRRVIREREPAEPSTRLSTMMRADLSIVSQHRGVDSPKLIREVRGDLDWIVMKALEKDRARRYETANGLALDIKRYLANEPISARPPSKVYRLRKTILRNKLLFAGASAIAALLTVSLIVVSIALQRERQASVKSQQVTKFLEAMLNGVGSSVARGRDRTMLREILNETAASIGNDLSNQPEVEAELCCILGKLYHDLGDAGKGEALVHRSLGIRENRFGSDSLETAVSLDLLGRLLVVQHKVSEAEQVYSKALAIRRQRLGNENADTATSLDGLAEVYREQRRLIEAESMAGEALRVRKMLLGDTHLDVAGSLRNLGMIQGYRERWIEAERTLAKVLAIRRKLLGDEDPRVASALEDRGWALNAMGRFDEAQKLNAEALVIRNKYLGVEHPDVSRNLNSLGQLLMNRGEVPAATGVLKAVLAIQRKLLGDDNVATLETFSSLAKSLQREGNAVEAESLWRETLAIGKRVWDDNHEDRLLAMRGLADSLESQQRWPEAEEIWRESLPLWRKKEGIEGRESMYTLRKLGLAFEAERKWPEAESTHHEALAISSKKGDEDSEALIDSERVVRVLVAEKKFSEAQQLLDKVLTPAFVAKPDSVNLLIQRVSVMGRRGRWKEASADASLALQNQPTDHYHYHTLAALLAMTGDRSAYEQVCKRLVTKFADTTNPYVSERIAQDNLLLPDSGADLALMDKLADQAVTAGSGTDGLPYFQACKAMSLYRLGNFSEALAWGKKAANGSNGFAQAKACAVLAMAHCQLGQRDEALAELGKGNALAPAISTENGADDLGESWVAWLMARISLDEAAKLVHAGSTFGENSNPR